jgi:hypothetical protein
VRHVIVIFLLVLEVQMVVPLVLLPSILNALQLGMVIAQA